MIKSQLKGKKLLVLAGNDVHIKVVEAAKELGVYTIVTDYLPLESSPAKKLADEYWAISTGDIDAVVKKCREEHVDGVLNFCIDTVQKHYQLITEKLGLPCYGTASMFDVFTNKVKFKDYCRRFCVDVIPEYSEEDIENGSVLYPILIKPSDSRGSRGITICESSDMVNDAIKLARQESTDGKILIERYMGRADCHDIGLAYIVIDSIPYLTKISDRVLGNVKDGLQCQQMASILPSRFVGDFLDKVNQNVTNLIKSTGMKFGPVFMQGIWSGGRMYMYDPGLRFPGSDFDVVMKDVTGFDSMKCLVEFAVTGRVTACYGEPRHAYKYNGGACVILAIACRSGVINTFSGFNIVASMAEVKSARQIYTVGQYVPQTHDVRQRVAEFVAYIPNRNDINLFIKRVYSYLQILDEDGRDMVVSKICYCE